jgi:SAM-dependent methyltransferase
VNKTVTIDLTSASTADAAADARARTAGGTPDAHPQALLDLPPGEARESLLAVHGLLGRRLPPTRLAIYEAGGGSTSFLPLEVLRRAHVTVVDIDEAQICNNDYAQQAILGDVQIYRFPPGSFDLVICYNVIEHLSDVEAALERFCEALKRGGLMLISAPNPNSLSGVVTKYTPHWFHVWFYRHIRGEKQVGEPGHPPFPTVFHPLVTLSNLEAFAKRLGLELIYRREYESPRYPEMRGRMPAFAALIDAAAAVLNFLLAGKVDVRRGDYHVILRKL